ncbi:Crp/Fnr family transcriptional regulator [Actinokineospora bangkokensis]|uniref:Cyclic nucleotide-binding protein n=1 Tax=Actinokineospora bangkokensis TaxID=1193682 RepID=A0A1Q9LS14_9PSEU|nr:Crp/Fnr family transcriptional regulator [Actinokineospora bangkokensis]OLR94812.1 cyclic nucleotide-binding protein [Actinokineospora bangkokensis]
MALSPGVATFHDLLRTALLNDPALATRTHVPKGSVVYNAGDLDDRMYVVEVGQLKTMTTATDGKQCLLSIHLPSDMFGELSLLGQPRQDTAIAMRHSVLRQFNAARLAAVLRQDDRMSGHFTQFLMSRLLDQQVTITQLITMDSEHRLAATLLRTARKLGRRTPAGTYIDVRLTQEDLASMVGTTRSRVGLFLKNFREHGLLRLLPRSLLLVHEDAVAAYLEDAIVTGPVPAAVPGPVGVVATRCATLPVPDPRRTEVARAVRP